MSEAEWQDRFTVAKIGPRRVKATCRACGRTKDTHVSWLYSYPSCDCEDPRPSNAIARNCVTCARKIFGANYFFCARCHADVSDRDHEMTLGGSCTQDLTKGRVR